MQTATNPQTGEKLVLQNGQWVPLGTAVPQSMTIGTPRPKQPSPVRPIEEATDQVNYQLKVRELDQADTKSQGENIDRISGIRKEFNSLPEVKTYSEGLSALGGALRAPDNAQGDLGVVYAFAKAMDPASVVREGEMDMATSTSSVIQDLYRKYGQIREGNRLPPEVRRQLLETARQKVGALNQGFTQRYKYYREIAERSGLDPRQVVGDHPGDAFRDLEQGYLKTLPDDQAQAELRERIARGDDPAETIQWLISTGRPPSKDIIDRIIANAGNTNPDVRPPESAENPNARALGLGVGDIAESIGDTLGIVANPLNAGINAIAGTNLGTDLGQSFRDMSGMPSPQNNQERLASSINSMGTAGLGIAGAARKGAQYAGGAVQGALQRLGAAPLTDAAAGASGGAASEGARQAGASPPVQLLAALGGGAAGVAGASRVGRMANPGPPVSTALTRAGEAEGVTVNRAMVDPSVQQKVTAVDRSMAGGPIMQRKMGEIGGQIEEGVKRLGRGGEPLEPVVAGQTVQGAADRYIKTSGAQFKKRYDAVEKASGGVKVPPTQSLARVDEVIAKLSETPETNGPELAFLHGLRRDLGGAQPSGRASTGRPLDPDQAELTRALHKHLSGEDLPAGQVPSPEEMLGASRTSLRERGGFGLGDALSPPTASQARNEVAGLSVGALRRLRTKLRKKISKGELTFGENEADVLSIMDTASEDIANGLAAAGKKGVAAEFKRVDADYRDRMQFIGGTVQKLVGRRGANLPPERVLSNLKAMASPKGDSGGLARMMRELEPEEQADIAATLAEGLGKNGKGEFSTAFLVSQAQKLPKASREAAFGPEGAKSLDNLITLAKEHSRVMGKMGGSPTGVANDYRGYLLNLVFGGGLGALQGGVSSAAIGAGGLVAAKAGRDLINARMLMNPKIANWLRTAPRTTSPKAIDAHYDRLKAIATREPALGAEIDQIVQAIARAANENVTPGLAAEQGDPNRE